MIVLNLTYDQNNAFRRVAGTSREKRDYPTGWPTPGRQNYLDSHIVAFIDWLDRQLYSVVAYSH